MAAFAYWCDYCRVPFGKDVHIQCAECRDIRLCVTCFSHGKEVPPHRRSHDYFVIEYMDSAIYDDAEWSGHEDILLLDAIEKFGLGNWTKIAAHINSNKTARDVETHYLSVYCAAEDDDDNENEIDD